MKARKPEMQKQTETLFVIVQLTATRMLRSLTSHGLCGQRIVIFYDKSFLS